MRAAIPGTGASLPAGQCRCSGARHVCASAFHHRARRGNHRFRRRRFCGAGEVTAVYVLDQNGAARMRQVRLGEAVAGGGLEVLAGIVPGEQVEPV